MNIIKVKDFDSMQSITVSLARNGYLVTADSITDENYKEHWEIKYCEVSKITENQNNNNCINSFEIYNVNCTKGVKCKILPDEKPSVVNDDNDSDFKSVSFDEKEKPLVENDDNDSDFKSVSFDEKEKPLVENEKEVIDSNPYGLVPRT